MDDYWWDEEYCKDCNEMDEEYLQELQDEINEEVEE